MIKYKKGFSFIEVIVVIAVLATLFVIGTINLIGASQRTFETSAVSVFVSDFKLTQLKAMNSEAESFEERSNYGIYFGENEYVLFKGNAYNPNDASNFAVSLSDGSRFDSILFPNSQIIFAIGSGEIANFVNGQNSTTIISGLEEETLTFNRLGTLIQE